MHTQEIVTPNNLHEAEMKASLLDHWRAVGKITVTDTIINEFTFNGLNRRIDLAIVKDNELIGVEIKSAADTLERLSGQLKEYGEFFDKIYIFVCEKHENKCLSLLSAKHELLVLKGKNIKTVKRGRRQLVSEKLSYIKMMRANELAQLLKRNNEKSNLKGRKQLEALALNLPKSQLRKSSFLCLKHRFYDSSLEFWKTVNENVTVSNIHSLQRNRTNVKKRLRKDSISNTIKNGSWSTRNHL